MAGPGGGGDPQGCNWIWLGDIWSMTNDTCPDGCGCDTPDADGTFLGQTAFTACNCP